MVSVREGSKRDVASEFARGRLLPAVFLPLLLTFPLTTQPLQSPRRRFRLSSRGSTRARSRRSSPTLSRSSRSRSRRPTTSAGRTSTSSGLCRRCVSTCFGRNSSSQSRVLRRQFADIAVSARAGYGWWPINVSLGCEASLGTCCFFLRSIGQVAELPLSVASNRNTKLFPPPPLPLLFLTSPPAYQRRSPFRLPSRTSFSQSMTLQSLSDSGSLFRESSGATCEDERVREFEVCLSWLTFLRRRIIYRVSALAKCSSV